MAEESVFLVVIKGLTPHCSDLLNCIAVMGKLTHFWINEINVWRMSANCVKNEKFKTQAKVVCVGRNYPGGADSFSV